MKKKLRFISNERVDLVDAHGIHDEADEDLRSRTRALISADGDGACVISGFSCVVNPDDDTQIIITPGAAILREVLPDGTLSAGQLINMLGEDAIPVDLSGEPHTDLGIYIAFVYRDGDTSNRAKWRPDLAPEREEIDLINTRQIAGVQVDVAANSPGPEWLRIYLVRWDGGLVAGDLQDVRNLFFEGQAAATAQNPASSYSFASLSRSLNREAYGVKTLRQWVGGVATRLMELAGRPRWFDAPGFGENVRSASASVTIRSSSGATQTAHLTFAPGDAAANRTNLALLMMAPNYAASMEDPRCDVCFLPGAGLAGDDSDIVVDTSAGAVIAAGTGYGRSIRGAARWWRTAGNGALLETHASGFRAVFNGLTFYATDGSGALLRTRSAADDLVFTNCVFDGTGTAEVTALVSIESAPGARVTFINCRFILRDGGGQTGVLIPGGADVRFIGGRITGGGSRGINVTSGVPGILSATGMRIDGMATCLKAVMPTGIHLAGCIFGPTATLFDVPGMGASAADAGFYNGGTLAAGMVSGGTLEARGTVIYFGTSRDRTLLHNDASIVGFSSTGEPSDMHGRYLKALSGRVYFAGDSIRWQQSAAERVVLLDAAGDDPVNSEMQANTILLGREANNPRARINRNLTCKAWGAIGVKSAWLGDGTGDRAVGGGLGHFSSRTVSSAGGALAVRAYYPTGGSGLTADPATSDDQQYLIFKISGLGLDDKQYAVMPHVTYDVGDGRPTNWNLGNPATASMEWTLEAFVVKQTADEFYMVVMKTTASTGNRTMNMEGYSWSGVAIPEIRVYFEVHAIANIATFVNGGAG